MRFKGSLDELQVHVDWMRRGELHGRCMSTGGYEQWMSRAYLGLLVELPIEFSSDSFQ